MFKVAVRLFEFKGSNREGTKHAKNPPLKNLRELRAFALKGFGCDFEKTLIKIDVLLDSCRNLVGSTDFLVAAWMRAGAFCCILFINAVSRSVEQGNRACNFDYRPRVTLLRFRGEHPDEKEKDMDKQFWLSVKKNDFALPAGHAVLPLTEELLSYLGSTDPELRDTIGLEAFYHWLDQGLYGVDDLRGFIPRLIANWQTGLGETESDSVFQRSFSSLWLAVIVENDLKKPAFKGEDLAPITEALLAYLPAERDLRGNIPVKGWAHAIAHAADLFAALACSPHTGASEHLKSIDCIAAKLRDATDWIYVYGEESRLAVAVVQIFGRGSLGTEQIKEWLASLSADWNNSWWDEGRARAFFNGRNFLRSLHYKILASENIPDKDAILKLLRDTLDHVQPFMLPE